MEEFDGRILIAKTKTISNIKFKYKINGDIFLSSILNSLIFLTICLNAYNVFQMIF